MGSRDNLLTATDMTLFEPPWKMVLSNKAILPLLWEMFPDHPNLLPSYFSAPNTSTPFVEKPFFSREGEGIVVDTRFTGSPKQVIYQQYCELPSFSGNFPGHRIVDYRVSSRRHRGQGGHFTHNK